MSTFERKEFLRLNVHKHEVDLPGSYVRERQYARHYYLDKHKMLHQQGHIGLLFLQMEPLWVVMFSPETQMYHFNLYFAQHKKCE